jgi:ribose transport system ATP-binding protein
MSVIKAVGIVKEFTGVRVLHDIDLDVEKGEVLGVIGENGAGKSTFVKILSGFYPPNKGEIYLRGKHSDLRDPLSAKSQGIAMIHHELNLADDLTVEENIFLGAEKRRPGTPFLDKRSMAEAAKALMSGLETDVDPNRKVGELSVADKQMVEIAKAVSASAEIIIMDEPTAVLTQHEIDILFGLIRRLKESGVTIIYISHRLREVRQICDRVAVLRDGHLIAVREASSLTDNSRPTIREAISFSVTI